MSTSRTNAGLSQTLWTLENVVPNYHHDGIFWRAFCCAQHMQKPVMDAWRTLHRPALQQAYAITGVRYTGIRYKWRTFQKGFAIAIDPQRTFFFLSVLWRLPETQSADRPPSQEFVGGRSIINVCADLWQSHLGCIHMLASSRWRIDKCASAKRGRL